MQLFEFSSEWNVSTFLLLVILAGIITILIRKAIKTNPNICAYKNPYFIIVFAILVFFESARSVNTGVDTQQYVAFFENVHNQGFSYAMGPRYGQFEAGFNLYIFLVSRISGSYTFLFFVNGVINSLCFIRYVHHFYRKRNSFVYIVLFILTYRYYLSAMRSGLANSLILLSIVFFDEKKYKKALIVAGIASLIHGTALVNLLYLLFIFLFMRYRDRIPVRRFVILSIIGLIGMNVGFSQIGNVLLNTRYYGYVERATDGSLGYWFVIVSTIISIYILYRQKKKNEEYSLEALINIMLFAIFPVYAKLGAYRIPQYYMMCRIGTYNDLNSELIDHSANSSTKSIILLLDFLIIIFFLFFYISRSASGLSYEFVWDS